jgi:hypothetical protein
VFGMDVRHCVEYYQKRFDRSALCLRFVLGHAVPCCAVLCSFTGIPPHPPATPMPLAPSPPPPLTCACPTHAPAHGPAVLQV